MQFRKQRLPLLSVHLSSASYDDWPSLALSTPAKTKTNEINKAETNQNNAFNMDRTKSACRKRLSRATAVNPMEALCCDHDVLCDHAPAFQKPRRSKRSAAAAFAAAPFPLQYRLPAHAAAEQDREYEGSQEQ